MSGNASTGAAAKARSGNGFALAQRLGRSLMLPIAVLPAAALLQRLGQKDLLGSIPFVQSAASVIGAAGGALFNNLPLLFAIGVAIGFAKRSDGSTALAGAVGYLVLSGVLWEITGTDPSTSYNKGPYGVLGGIIAGLVAAWLWQRYHRIKLPDYLAFFGGRRFVPIATALSMLVTGTVLGLVYPVFDKGLTAFSNLVTANSVAGGGIYGVINRLLLPLGLHHIPNNIVWFLFGDFQGQHGDINRFFAGDPSSGTFMTGFFPIFLFALPAAALAITHCARPEQRKVIGGIMLSAALTSFLTGVTEPLEYTFIYVAWPLLAIHAVLTGSAFVLVNALDIHTGFGFSAGAIDFVLNYGISRHSLWLIPIGLVYAIVYYAVFRFVITKWNLRTPGREDDDSAESDAATSSGAATSGDAGKTGGTTSTATASEAGEPSTPVRDQGRQDGERGEEDGSTPAT